MAITLDGTNGIGAPGTETFGDGTALGGATNPIVSMARAANNYVQSYIVNNTNGTSASADFVAYPPNGSDTHGWVDMGITSQAYADSTYTVTGPNEAYLFGSAPSGSGSTGNLVIATDNTGTANSIQFYTGGFTQAKGAWKMQLTSTGLQLANALPITSGGTGTTSTTFANLTTNVTGTLPIANGGTNSTATPTSGGVGYGTGTAHAYTSAGTAGQALISTGSGAPTWGSAGAMTLLGTTTAAASSTIDITFSGSYSSYVIVINNLKMSIDGNVTMAVTLNSFSSVTNWTSNQAYGVIGGTNQGTASTNIVGYSLLNTYPCSGNVTFYDPLNSGTYTSYSGMFNGYNSTATPAGWWAGTVGGFYAGAQATQGVRFAPSSGNFTTGTFKLYGIT